MINGVFIVAELSVAIWFGAYKVTKRVTSIHTFIILFHARKDLYRTKNIPYYIVAARKFRYPQEMAEPNPHQMMTCPYNKSHQIEHYKLHNHLQKCRKQYPNCNKVTCPFDATHVVNDVELDYHVTTCPKRAMLDTQMYIIDDEHRPVVPLNNTTPVVETDENWDNDCTSSYKPDLSVKPAHVIMKIKGATRSERRKARMEGVKTFRAYESTD